MFCPHWCNVQVEKDVEQWPFSDHKSNDLIGKTPSNRKPRVPCTGRTHRVLKWTKWPVTVENLKEFRMSFMTSHSLLTVGVWGCSKDNKIVQDSKIAEQASWGVFWGYWGPQKNLPIFYILQCMWIFTSLFPPSPRCELRCSLVLNWISAYLLPCLWLPLLFICHFSLHQIDFF